MYAEQRLTDKQPMGRSESWQDGRAVARTMPSCRVRGSRSRLSLMHRNWTLAMVDQTTGERAKKRSGQQADRFFNINRLSCEQILA